MVSKYKQKKKKNYRNYGKSNKELNALIEKKNQRLKKEEGEKRNSASALLKNTDFRQ